MKKSVILALIFCVFGFSQVKAEAMDTQWEMFNAIFLLMPGVGEEMRSGNEIAQSLKEKGFTVTSTKPSTTKCVLDYDHEITVKSVETIYSKDGNKVVINIPKFAKYKRQFKLCCIFKDLESRNRFFSVAEDYGFQRTDYDVNGIDYWGLRSLISTDSRNNLKVYISA